MRPILQSNNKKALSNIVAYVLLISITISLSVVVYNWLRFYVGEDEIPVCSDGVNLIIQEYICSAEDKLILTLKNKGRFNVDGFALRVHNRTDPEFGFYMLNETGTTIAPGEEIQITTDISDSGPAGKFETITLIEIQPYQMEKGKISCRSVASQKVEDCTTP